MSNRKTERDLLAAKFDDFAKEAPHVPNMPSKTMAEAYLIMCDCAEKGTGGDHVRAQLLHLMTPEVVKTARVTFDDPSLDANGLVAHMMHSFVQAHAKDILVGMINAALREDNAEFDAGMPQPTNPGNDTYML
jgi:hypothetical protein